MATLGSLVVSLEANVAKFQSDLGRAATMAENAGKQISSAMTAARGAIEGMAAAAGLDKLYDFGMRVIESTAKLQDLHVQTGLSVEALSALRNEAARAGTDLDSATGAFDKMQKLAFQAAGGSKQATNAFAAIGVSAQQVAEGLKDPDELLRLVSQHLAGYVDDGNKAALMMELFGKSGASMNELLRNIAENGFGAATATAEQAKQAKEAADAVAEWKTQWEAITTTITLAVLPAVSKALAFIKVGFTILATTASNVWATMKYDAIFMWQSIVDVVRDGAADIGALLAKSPFKFSQEWGKSLLEWGSKSGQAIDDATADWKASLASNADIVKEAMADYENATNGVMRPTVAPPAAHIKPPNTDDALKAIKATMEAKLKALEANLKAQDALTKLYNTKLDADYQDGAISLADYGAAKMATLQDNLAKTLKIYDEEESAIRSYMATLKTKQDMEAANGKLAQINASRQEAVNNEQSAAIVLNQKLVKEGQALTRSVSDINIAYARMNGNTELANALATDQQDALLKTTLLANHLGDAYQKLMAIEQDSAMRASRKGIDGIKRAITDYGKSLQDVASKTADVTQHMLDGLENSLVSFVTTGKANFKDLANSIIADIARITIEQGIMKPLTNWLSGYIGGFGGGGGDLAGAFSGTAASGVGGYAATGAMTSAGMAYTVGENGPETFVPNSAGRIIPNGDNGSVTINTHIDARGATTDLAAALPGILRRNNETVKADIVDNLRRRKYRV